ncbi:MAG: 2-C-methyl-D-erythritol 4-phosphate cytidylyltransferase [Acidimicrobiia bacterium]|nr:2-C-methyl-D-erythritol 4-phosphate cytidylyltransferase [Acidimicrobiia bacterium]
MIIGALVTAAGSGSRLGAPKQFLTLGPSERLVDRAVTTVAAVASWTGVILPARHSWDGPTVDAVVTGGDSRYASIEAGLAVVPPEIDIVVVHSASHPLASIELIHRVVGAVASGADGAVPFLEAVDVVKRHSDQGTLTTVGREGLGSAQCPMAFARPMLERAFAETDDGTEESELVERIGGRVVAVAGDVANLHVVDLASLHLARTLAAADISSPVAPPV